MRRIKNLFALDLKMVITGTILKNNLKTNSMKQYIFTKTYNSGRGMHVGFPIWDDETFLQEVKKEKKGYFSMYRFGCIGGYMNNLKDMDLKTFELVFPQQPFSSEEITALFRKEISLKYGEHKKKAELKTVSIKDILLGSVLEDSNGVKWINLGLVTREIDRKYYASEYEKKGYEKEILEGNGYIDVTDLKYPDSLADRVHVLKSKKRFVKVVKDEKFQLSLQADLNYYSGEGRTSYWGSRPSWERHTKIIIHKKLK